MSSRKKRRRDGSSKTERPTEPREKRRRPWLLAASAVALFVVAAVLVRRPDATRRADPWNVVLVSIDTLRADHVSAYGGAVPTPHLDRLAERGVLFERVQSPAPATLPAHASLFTARTPPGHGVRDNVGFYLPEDARTLAAELRAHGYRTGGFVGAFVLDSRFGIDAGFEDYFDDFETLADDVAQGFVSQRRGDAVLERALGWLQTKVEGPSPWFAFLHFYDPHAPYDPPPPYGGGKSLRERYGGEVAYTDALVGELLDWLDARGLSEKTLVVLTSDHGESLGEHGEPTHGLFVYESTLRVPLVMRYPGAPAGSRITPYVRLIDVAPTILDLLALPPLPEADGTSLVPLIEGSETEPDRPHYAESYFPRLNFGWSELRSLREGAHKLILAPRPELYDLESDPEETRNLFDEQPAVARRLRTEIETWTASASAPERASLDPASRSKLESLGYVDGGSATGASRSFSELPDPKDRLDVYLALIDPAIESVEPGDGRAFALALSRLERVVSGEEIVPRAYVLLGELLLKAGRNREAEATFSRLVREQEGSFDGPYGLGVARHRLGELQAAEEAFRKAHEIEPRNTKVHFQLAELAAARGDVESAERWLREAIELSPNRFLQERLASLLLEAGRAREARDIFRELVDENGEDPLDVYNLGQSLLMEGDVEQALAMFRAAAEARPDDPDIQQAIGNASISTGDSEAALAAFERAVALSPCFVAAQANLGTLLAELGRRDEAVQAFEKALSCDPGYAHAYGNLAALKLDAGDLTAAIETLERGRKAVPGDATLARHLAELQAFRDRSR